MDDRSLAAQPERSIDWTRAFVLAAANGFRGDLSVSKILQASKDVYNQLLPELLNCPIRVQKAAYHHSSNTLVHLEHAHTRLAVAALTGNVARVRQLLSLGADPCGYPDTPPARPGYPRAPPPAGSSRSLQGQGVEEDSEGRVQRRLLHPHHGPVIAACTLAQPFLPHKSLLACLVESIEMRQAGAGTAVPIALLLLQHGMIPGHTPAQLTRTLIQASRMLEQWAPLFHTLLDPSYPLHASHVLSALRLGDHKAGLHASSMLCYLIRGALLGDSSDSAARVPERFPSQPASHRSVDLLRVLLAAGTLPTCADNCNEDPLWMLLHAQISNTRYLANKFPGLSSSQHSSMSTFSSLLAALLPFIPAPHILQVWPGRDNGQTDQGVLLAAVQLGIPGVLQQLLERVRSESSDAPVPEGLLHAVLNRAYCTGWRRVETLLQACGRPEGAPDAVPCREMDRLLRAAGAEQ